MTGPGRLCFCEGAGAGLGLTFLAGRLGTVDFRAACFGGDGVLMSSMVRSISSGVPDRWLDCDRRAATLSLRLFSSFFMYFAARSSSEEPERTITPPSALAPLAIRSNNI